MSNRPLDLANITGDMIRDRDAHARIIARMVAENVDRNDHIFQIHVQQFSELDAQLNI